MPVGAPCSRGGCRNHIRNHIDRSEYRDPSQINYCNTWVSGKKEEDCFEPAEWLKQK